MNKLYSEFKNIYWPKVFVVVFKDGESQLFDSSQGVQWDDGSNYYGADENRPNISCAWKKKSPSQ